MVVGQFMAGGGVYAALNNLRLGLVDNWTRHVRDVRDKQYQAAGRHLHPVPPRAVRTQRAIEQVVNVAQSTGVMQGMPGPRGQKVTLHGWCCSLNSLATSPTSGNDRAWCVGGLEDVYNKAVEKVAAAQARLDRCRCAGAVPSNGLACVIVPV